MLNAEGVLDSLQYMIYIFDNFYPVWLQQQNMNKMSSTKNSGM